MTKLEGTTKSEAQNAREDPFVIRASTLIRHWSFVIRHFPVRHSCFVICSVRHSDFVIFPILHFVQDDRVK